MFLELRNKLVVFDRLSNPFRRRGLLRLADRHPRAYLTLTLSLGLCGYLFLLLFPMYLVFSAASQTVQDVNAIPPRLGFGDQFFVNLQEAWVTRDFQTKFVNSLIVATGTAVRLD